MFVKSQHSYDGQISHKKHKENFGRGTGGKRRGRKRKILRNPGCEVDNLKGTESGVEGRDLKPEIRLT